VCSFCSQQTDAKGSESAATALWKQTYMATLQQQLKHPYLKSVSLSLPLHISSFYPVFSSLTFVFSSFLHARAAFAFLLTDGAQQPTYQTYRAILEDV
jgi:hypothetical protein